MKNRSAQKTTMSLLVRDTDVKVKIKLWAFLLDSWFLPVLFRLFNSSQQCLNEEAITRDNTNGFCVYQELVF